MVILKYPVLIHRLADNKKETGKRTVNEQKQTSKMNKSGLNWHD